MKLKGSCLANNQGTDILTGLLYISVLVSYDNKLLKGLTDINCRKLAIGMLLIIDFQLLCRSVIFVKPLNLRI